MPALFSLFLTILLPVFTLVALGAVAGPRLQIDARSISKLAYYILSPAFLFNVLSKATFDPALVARMYLYILLVTVAMGIVAFLLARLLRCPPDRTAAFVLVAVVGNVGNFGIPITQFRFGAPGLEFGSLYYLFLSIVGFTLGVSAATWNRNRGWRVLLAVFKTPSILAAIAAVLVNWIGWGVPLFVDRAVGLLANAMIPSILLTLGMQLARMGRPKLERDVFVAALVRLLCGPLFALALAAPFALTGVVRGAGVLQASMPSAVIGSLIALEHNLEPDFVTTVVFVSTLTSALTLTFVLAIV